MGFMESGRIDKNRLVPQAVDDASDGIPGRLRFSAGYGYFFAGQCIDKRRFADVCPPDDSDKTEPFRRLFTHLFSLDL
jgi:hypothetical protein